VPPFIRKIDKMIAEDETLDYDYVAGLGPALYTQAATKFLLGNDHPRIVNKEV
jgi:hypothetical protein